MKKTKLILSHFILALTTIFLLSCGGGGGEGEEPPKEESKPPSKTIGTLPTNGEPCSDYEEVDNDDVKVLVEFRWNAAQLAQNYVLEIFEGTTEVFKSSFNNLEAKVQLDRGKTYSWSLTAVNNDGETAGDTYSFTTPGIPEANYAPYAAAITIEFNTQNMEMSVAWVGSDEDNDELTYDVTVSENESILVEETDYNMESINPVAFKNGENYSVEVISKDTSGNFSVSKMSAIAPD
ncbi:hypothetical protein [Flagellimonas sp.]|uniref:hypothetical protein n=1 Tax=Flagellimonas sp. TaxID=2058762 RepID=UPI003B5D0499